MHIRAGRVEQLNGALHSASASSFAANVTKLAFTPKRSNRLRTSHLDPLSWCQKLTHGGLVLVGSTGNCKFVPNVTWVKLCPNFQLSTFNFQVVSSLRINFKTLLLLSMDDDIDVKNWRKLHWKWLYCFAKIQASCSQIMDDKRVRKSSTTDRALPCLALLSCDIYLSIHPSIHSFMHPCTHASIYLSTCTSRSTWVDLHLATT